MIGEKESSGSGEKASDLGSVTDIEVEEEEEEEKEWDALEEEEENLRTAREANEGKTNEEVEGTLTPCRLEELDSMLNKTDMYSQFMKEAICKMGDDEEKTGNAENDPEETKGKKKRKGGQAKPPSSSANKRQKKNLTPTQEFLPLVTGDLRDYQLNGVRWMLSLYKNGLNGILADEMGLGKTIQTIGLFAFLRQKRILGPFIVIAPLSTVGNWLSEFNRFAPSIPCLLYHGDKAERARLRATKLSGKVTSSFPVIVTTYEIVMNDISFFMKFKFKSMIVDEGHRLKNHKCKLIRQLRAITAGNKILLTGTPLQNTLSELWSILNFILPHVFDQHGDFESWFDFSAVRQGGGDQAVVAMEQRNKVVTKLHSILKPFFLRRLKSDCNLKLPEKQEIIMYAKMTQYQKNINKELIERKLVQRLTEEKARNGSVCVSVGGLRKIVMQMRKNCNHPDLIEGGYDGSTVYPPIAQLLEQCGKMKLLDRLINKLRKDGHKVIIFSQMTRMLDILDYYFSETWHEPCRIDGSVGWKERQEQIVRFNSPDGPGVFLLSTRAGGLGINLTAADTAIIYDSDWNPQQDLQAMDRCHRIGQTKPVLVLRLITADSVEVRMIKRAADKMVLERLVMKKGAFRADLEDNNKPTSLGVDELLALLQSDVKLEDVAQEDSVSDETLDRLLNRDHMVEKKPPPYPQMDVGYEVVVKTGSTIFSKLEGEKNEGGEENEEKVENEEEIKNEEQDFDLENEEKVEGW
ncbi:hypothetical protein BSKO_11487 [Bryopsis sp. KO-2023]|nr:hypothetical protein BSKO_11487 [Bryopsis sp. KO-2023]